MTFENIYNSLEACTVWFFGSFFNPLINFIKNSPLLTSFILIFVGLPSVILIFDFFKYISLNKQSLNIYNKHLKNSYKAFNFSKLRRNFYFDKKRFTIKRK